MTKTEQAGEKRGPQRSGGANPPQHIVGDYGEAREQPPQRDGLPTGSGTSNVNDVADPHPANEEHYDKQVRPGGANPPSQDIGPNNAVHDGKPARRPLPRPGSPA